MTPSSEANPASILEVEADSKLQLPHSRATFQAGDLPVVSTLAINAVVSSIVCTESIDGVIENVEGVHPELRADSFRDMELLYRRHVRVEARRAMVGVPAKVAQVSATRIGEDSGVGDDVRNRGEVGNGMGNGIQRTHSRTECA